jgi:NTP pyrophosphatase (non-canonical NTP hydrolase)
MPESQIDKLVAISAGYMRLFPEGNDPFQILARLLEECGELAQQVHHFEDCGVKRAKYGEPDREHLAKEVREKRYNEDEWGNTGWGNIASCASMTKTLSC